MKKATFVQCCAAIAVLLCCPSRSHAQYIPDGAAVSTSPSGQWVKHIVPDGAGGAIMVWEDWRGTSNDIYAQRLDPWGYSQWIVNGTPLCTAAGQQQSPRCIPEGAGGAIVTWSDSRSGTYIIYAQRIDGAGNAQWTPDGIPLATGTQWQQYPAPVADGAGGAIVFWQSGIGSAADIYAQRVNANGEILWAGDGVAVCSAAGSQSSLFAIPDGSGGAIAAWTDRRSGTDDIYAQRIDASGAPRWTPNGIAVCSAVQNQSAGGIADDGSGGAVIGWTDYRSGTSWRIYAQRVDSLGAARWTADGVLVPTRPGNASNLRVAPDGTGGAFTTWVAASSGDSLFAVRLDGNGSPLWMTPLSPAGTSSVSNLIPDETGGAIVSWEMSGNIYTQRFDADGTMAWQIDGVETCLAIDLQRYPTIASDGAGGVIAAWWDYRNSGGSAFEGDVYAARVDAGGNIVATLLESFASFLEEGAVVIRWTLSDIDNDAEFAIFRSAAPGGSFERIIDPAIERSGLSFSFRDTGCRPGAAYRHRVEVIGAEGSRLLFETDAVVVPAIGPILFQNHPNPFNPSTTIPYSLSEDAWVILELYDIEGRLVARLVDRHQTHGRYEVRWNGTDSDGHSVGSGVYMYRLKAGKYAATRKMILVR